MKYNSFICKPVKCIYSKDDFRIYATKSDDKKLVSNKYGNVSIMGNMPELVLNVEYKVTAKKEDGKYGVSYRVHNIRRDKPMSPEGVKLFLEEILPMSQAQEIYRVYPNIIEMLMHDREDEVDVNLLYNIKHERIKVIKRKIIENFVFAEVIEEFKGLLDFKAVKTLYSKYKTVESIKKHMLEEPYNVMMNIMEKSFSVADKTLLKFEEECNNLENPPVKWGEPLITSVMRMRAAINHVLISDVEGNGHTKYPVPVIKTMCRNLVRECFHRFDEAIKHNDFIIVENDVSRFVTYDAEMFIAGKLIEAVNVENKWDIDISKYQQDGDMCLTDQQMNGIKNVIELNASVLNGSAGVGKSQTTATLIKILKDNNKSFVALAPTGRAASVSSGYIGERAYTIHKHLYGLIGSEIDRITEDVVIIDEFSMVDVFLFKWLLEFINVNHTKIMIIGDSAQLMSVGAGCVLHNIMNSKIVPTTTLDKVFRYGVGGVMTVATDTRNCKTYLEEKSGVQIIGEDKSYTFVHSSNVESTMDYVEKFYGKLLENNKPEDILVLSAYNVGSYGSIVLNKNLQRIANPKSIVDNNGIDASEGIRFYKDDLVIQTKNNYNSVKYSSGFSSLHDNYTLCEEWDLTFIANGEIGKIISIDDKYCLIDFYGNKVVYGKFELETCKLGYSISTHKSQGGGVKNVIMVSPKDHARSLSSNLLYVGITRAKEKVFHVGDVMTVNKSIQIKDENDRKTNLQRFLMTANKELTTDNNNGIIEA